MISVSVDIHHVLMEYVVWLLKENNDVMLRQLTLYTLSIIVK